LVLAGIGTFLVSIKPKPKKARVDS
jgi:hypothetical protein